MRKDAFYHQRVKEIVASIKPRDSYHDRLIKFGWIDISNEENTDLYKRPAYMGQERKIMSCVDACSETSEYTHEYRNPQQYKNGKKVD